MIRLSPSPQIWKDLCSIPRAWSSPLLFMWTRLIFYGCWRGWLFCMYDCKIIFHNKKVFFWMTENFLCNAKTFSRVTFFFSYNFWNFPAFLRITFSSFLSETFGLLLFSKKMPVQTTDKAFFVLYFFSHPLGFLSSIKVVYFCFFCEKIYRHCWGARFFVCVNKSSPAIFFVCVFVRI